MRGLILPTFVVLFALTKGSLAGTAADLGAVGAHVPVPPLSAKIVRSPVGPKGMLFADIDRKATR